MFKQIFLPLIVVATFITLVGLLGQGKLNYFFNLPSPTPKVSLKTVKIENLEIDVEVAKSADERAKGLSGRDRLDENSGMVFVFSKDSKPIFWMKDTKIALDIIWINYNKIVGIEKNVSPSTIDYVLEVNAGFSDKNNIRSGQMISGLEQL